MVRNDHAIATASWWIRAMRVLRLRPNVVVKVIRVWRNDMATQESALESRSDAAASTEKFETIVIGGGQAGLAVGYFLKKHGGSFVILDANEQIGGSWRTRTWNSLRLFTPARYDSLPGWSFPAAGWSYPTARETADYLEAYAARFDLPVRTGLAVTRLAKHGDC